MIFSKYSTFLFFVITLVLLSSCSSSMIKIVPYSDTLATKIDIEYPDYWTAMYLGAPNYLDSNDVSDDEAEFARGIELIMANDMKSAIPIMENLFYSRLDSPVSPMRYASNSLLWHYYISENRYDKCDSLEFQNYKIENAAFAKSSRIYSRLISKKPLRHDISSKNDTLPYVNDDITLPVIKVTINGKEFEMIYDTGAMTTVVSKEVAELCGLTPAVERLNVTGTSNEKNISTYIAQTDSICIGNSKFSNHFITVSADGNFEITFLWFWTISKFDGLIGWDIIKHFESEFDFENKRLVLKEPVKKDSVVSNLFWLNIPIVKAIDQRAWPFHFFYDSGAEVSNFTEMINHKLPKVEFGTAFEWTWGLGGSVWNFRDTYPETSMFIGDREVFFYNMRIQDRTDNLFKYDFIAGNNICRGGKIILDPLNGLFKIIPPSEKNE